MQASWFLTIVCGQAAHVWVCRTSTASLFEHGLWANSRTNIAVPLAIGLGCLFVYTPFLSAALLTTAEGEEKQRRKGRRRRQR